MNAHEALEATKRDRFDSLIIGAFGGLTKIAAFSSMHDVEPIIITLDLPYGEIELGLLEEVVNDWYLMSDHRYGIIGHRIINRGGHNAHAA